MWDNYLLLSEKKGEEGEGQSDLPASAIFLNSFNLRYSVCQGAVLGVACPKPHQCMDDCILL